MARTDDDVVTLGVRGPEAVRARRTEAAVGDDAVEQGVGVVEELARGGLAQDRRVFALQLPGEEEELPVDHLAQRGQVRLDGPDPGERRDREIAVRDPLTIGAGLLQGQQGPPLGLLVLLPELLLIGRGWRRPAPAARSSLSRSETTPTTRDASSTWIVVPS